MAKAPREPRDTARAGRGSPRGLSEEDLDLWRCVTRGDMRLPGREYVESGDELPTASAGIPDEAESRAAPVRSPVARRQDPPLEVGKAAGVDKRTAQRLRRGQISIEGRLDLHGLTQAEAHRALNGFLGDAQAAGKRCVIVITGKGRSDTGEGGVLRRAVPHWLDQPPNRGRIIAVRQAQPRHGGGGALYVLLRKAR